MLRGTVIGMKRFRRSNLNSGNNSSIMGPLLPYLGVTSRLVGLHRILVLGNKRSFHRRDPTLVLVLVLVLALALALAGMGIHMEAIHIRYILPHSIVPHQFASLVHPLYRLLSQMKPLLLGWKINVFYVRALRPLHHYRYTIPLARVYYLTWVRMGRTLLLPT